MIEHKQNRLILTMLFLLITNKASTKNIGIIIDYDSAYSSFIKQAQSNLNNIQIKKLPNILKYKNKKHNFIIINSPIGKVAIASATQKLISENNIDQIILISHGNVLPFINNEIRLKWGDIAVGAATFQYDYGYSNKNNFNIIKSGAIPITSKIINQYFKPSIYLDLSKYLPFKLKDIIELSKKIQFIDPKSIFNKKKMKKKIRNIVNVELAIIATADKWPSENNMIKKFIMFNNGSVVDMASSAATQTAHYNKKPIIVLSYLCSILFNTGKVIPSDQVIASDQIVSQLFKHRHCINTSALNSYKLIQAMTNNLLD